MAGNTFVQIEVTGLTELRLALLELPQTLRFKALRAVFFRAIRPTFLAARGYAELRKVSGATAMSIGRSVTKGRGADILVAKVGPRSRNKAARAQYARYYNLPRVPDRLRHFHLVEFGSINNRARPYLRPAADTTWRRVVNLVATDWQRAVQGVVRRHLRRAKRRAVA